MTPYARCPPPATDTENFPGHLTCPLYPTYRLAVTSTALLQISAQGILKSFEKRLGILSPCHGRDAVDDKERNSL